MQGAIFNKTGAFEAKVPMPSKKTFLAFGTPLSLRGLMGPRSTSSWKRANVTGGPPK